jgi:acyl-CoA thioester hydrolase
VSGRRSTLTLRVRYAETDQMGVAHHSQHVVWFEMGRVQYMQDLGVPYAEVERRGVYLVVSAIGVSYRRPAFFDEELRLACWISELRSRKVRFEYRLERVADGEVVADGFSEHIATSRERRTVALPEYLRAGLAADRAPGT